MGRRCQILLANASDLTGPAGCRRVGSSIGGATPAVRESTAVGKTANRRRPVTVHLSIDGATTTCGRPLGELADDS